MIEVAWPAGVGKERPGWAVLLYAACRSGSALIFMGGALIYQGQQSSDISKTGLQARAGERIWSACRCSSCEWG